MDEQRKFPSALFGFDKETVLNYIYELDANAKLREEQLGAEGQESLSALDALKAKYADAVTRLEEASSQYDILKAQFYNEKQSTQEQLQSHEQLRKDAQQLAVAARERDNELQIQKELNKQLQAKLETLQKQLEGETDTVRAQYEDKLNAAQTEYEAKLGELTARAESAEARAAGLESTITAVRAEYERKLLAAQTAAPMVQQPYVPQYYPAPPTQPVPPVYTPAPEPKQPEPEKETSAKPQKAQTKAAEEDAEADIEEKTPNSRDKYIADAVSEAQSELFALKSELSGLKKVLQNRINEFEDAISGLSTTQRRQYQQLRQQLEESVPVEPAPQRAEPVRETKFAPAAPAAEVTEPVAPVEPQKPAEPQPTAPEAQPEQSDMERKRQKILEIIAEQRRRDVESKSAAPAPKQEDGGSMEVPGDSFFH